MSGVTDALTQQNYRQMAESTALSMRQSDEQHKQELKNSVLENRRAMNNNWMKQARDALGDSMKNQSNTTNELGQRAAAG